jgi:hypothetical protein
MQCFLLPCHGFRDPIVTLALLFPLPFSLSVLIRFFCNLVLYYAASILVGNRSYRALFKIRGV